MNELFDGMMDVGMEKIHLKGVCIFSVLIFWELGFVIEIVLRIKLSN